MRGSPVAVHVFGRQFIMEDPCAGGHPLRIAFANYAATTVGIVMRDLTVENVAHGLETAVRMPRSARRLIRGIDHWPDLVQQKKGIRGSQRHLAGERTPDFKTGALFLPMRLHNAGHRPCLAGGGSNSRKTRKNQWIFNGYGWHLTLSPWPDVARNHSTEAWGSTYWPIRAPLGKKFLFRTDSNMVSSEDSEGTVELSGAKVYMVFARAYRSVEAYLQARITAHGLYMSDFAVLEALLHKGALTVAVIAEKVGMGESSIVPSVDRLEALGFVRRRRARSENRFTITIDLTQPGHKLIEEIYRSHSGDIERILRPLSSVERIELYRLSKKVGLHSEKLQLARFRDSQGGLSRSQLRRATAFLAKASGAPASVSDVAAKLGLSPSQFSRAFKNTTGFPPHRWQLNHRIARAQELMRYGGLPLSQIALATGFTEQSHFTRAFKKVVGVSPGAWQRDNRQ